MNLEAPAVYRKLKPLAKDNLRAAETLSKSLGVAATAHPSAATAALHEEARRLFTSVGRTDLWLRRLLFNSSQIAALDKGFIPQVFEIAREGLRRKPDGTQVPADAGRLNRKDCLSLLKFCLYFLPGLRTATQLTAKSAPKTSLSPEGGR